MSSYKLELYFFYGCPYCHRVLSVIKKLNIEDKVTLKDIRKDKDALKKLMSDTGRKTVPCLYINDKPMHESADIMAWLESNKASI